MTLIMKIIMVSEPANEANYLVNIRKFRRRLEYQLEPHSS